MAHSKKNNNMYRCVLRWYASFIPLGIASVLFVICFVFESTLWLYAVCTVMFALFVVLFVRADKQVSCKDGYTLIQALAFYRECVRSCSEGNSEEAVAQQIEAIAQKCDYAKNLNTKQRIRLYKTGKTVYDQMDKKGGKHNV